MASERKAKFLAVNCSTIIKIYYFVISAIVLVLVYGLSYGNALLLLLLGALFFFSFTKSCSHRILFPFYCDFSSFVLFNSVKKLMFIFLC
jgi:hypothetical protein